MYFGGYYGKILEHSLYTIAVRSYPIRLNGSVFRAAYLWVALYCYGWLHFPCVFLWISRD